MHSYRNYVFSSHKVITYSMVEATPFSPDCIVNTKRIYMKILSKERQSNHVSYIKCSQSTVDDKNYILIIYLKKSVCTPSNICMHWCSLPLEYYFFCNFLSDVWRPILGICALHLTHPSAHTQ